MQLLPAGTAVLLELSLRFSDLCTLSAREQVGHDKWSNLDMPGLWQGAYDGVGGRLLLQVMHKRSGAMSYLVGSAVPDNCFHVPG